jgi:DNA-binding beta-propeller fold protein YncE
MTTPQMTAETLPPAVEGSPDAPVPAELAPEEERKRRRRKAIILFLLLGLLGILLLLLLWYFLFRQPLPIVPPIPDLQLPSYSTSVYGADKPVGVAVTPSGDRIYVTESGGDYGIRIFDGGGTLLRTVGFPESTGTNHVPVYLAIDPLTEEVYVTDRPTGTIHIFDRDGRYQRQFNPAAARDGWQPLGITFDKTGNLYVTDLSAPQKVLVFDRSGEVIRTIGSGAGMDFPNGVAIDDAGLLYVTDGNNGRLLVFNPDGSIAGQIGRGAGAGTLGLPRGLAIDGQGRVFVVDSSGNGVLLFRALQEDDPRPEYVGFFGGHGLADGEFAFPMGAAVDDRGRVYVADTANGRVQVWSY